MRSALRKSGRFRVASAQTTPTRVTWGKSWPLAIIWVPTRISTFPASIVPPGAVAPLRVVVSRSRRAMRAAGRSAASSSSSRSVPSPSGADLRPWQRGQVSGGVDV